MMARTNHLRGLVVLAAVSLAASLLVLVATGESAQAAFPVPNGLIAFTSDRDSTDVITDEIYVMNADGSSPHRLTNTSDLFEQWPALSPDGTKVAFQGFPNGPSFTSGSEIYVMDVEDKDGEVTATNRIPLTTNSTWDGHPTWSPDGTQLVFNSLRPFSSTSTSMDQEIYVMDAKDAETALANGTKVPDGQGDNLKRLTTHPGFDAHPVFSPKGDQIAFVSRGFRDNNPDGDAEIYVMKAEPESSTNVPRNLTNNSVDDAFNTQATLRFYSQLAWSPDESKIAFQRWENPMLLTSNVDIYAVNTNGSDPPTNLTSNTPATNERYPAWSPDGTKIAFWSGTGTGLGADGPSSEIMVMNSDGSGTPTNLTNNDDGDIQPNWIPDSTAPTTTATATTSDNSSYTSGTWTNKDVTVTLRAKDLGAGVKSISYSTDGGNTYTTVDGSSTTVNVTSEGQTDLYYYATDKAGNKEDPPKTFTVKIDKTKPETTADAGSYQSGTLTNKDVTLNLSAADEQNGSGVASVTYKVTNGGQDIAGETVSGETVSIPVSTEGENTITYYATDKAGNQEDAKTFTVKLDKTAPSVSSTTPKDGDTEVSRSTTVTAAFTEAIDPQTLTTTTVQLFSGNSKNPLKAQVNVSADGKTVTLTPSEKLDPKPKYTAKILGGTSGAKDLAGNPLAEDYVWYFTTGSQ